MASPASSTYSVGAGLPIWAGKYSGGAFIGAVTLDNLLPSAAMSSNLSAMAGAVTLDDAAPGGALAGYNPPAWLAGAALHQWVQIAGTSGAGSSQVDAYSGFTVTSTGKIVVTAAGGHTNSSDNRVSVLDLMADAPSWTNPVPASGTPRVDNRYYADGKPTSRHTYTNGFDIPAMNRVFQVGCNFAYGAGNSYAAVDAYNYAGAAWDAGGTYADLPDGDGSSKIGIASDGTAIWTNTLRKYVPGTNTWSAPITNRAASTPNLPWAYDSTRAQLFGLCWGTGGGGGSGLTASKVPVGGNTETAVTINASSAYTQWQADQPQYAGMDYDPVNDRFLFYTGQTFSSGNVASNVPGRVYVVTPNSGSAWDMSLLTLTGTAPGSGTADGSGINGRFRYVAALKGFVLLPQRTSNLYFFRVG